jgi:hypothetical protein
VVEPLASTLKEATRQAIIVHSLLVFLRAWRRKSTIGKLARRPRFYFVTFHISWSLGKGKERKASSHDCFFAHEEAAGIVAGPSDGKTLMKGANLEFS